MIEIQKGTFEERIITILLKQYPITVEELQAKSGLPRTVMERVLKAFLSRKIIELDILPDTSYIRLLRFDFQFIGRKETQRKTLKHKKITKERRVKAASKSTYEDMMYH